MKVKIGRSVLEMKPMTDGKRMVISINGKTVLSLASDANHEEHFTRIAGSLALEEAK